MTRRNPNIAIHRHSLALLDDTERAKAARRGEVVHLALEALRGPRDKAALERAVARALARLDLDPAEWRIEEDFVAPLAGALALDQMRQWFDTDAVSLTEAAIADAKGDVHRPDRVVIGPTGLDVVDFKVGRREEAHRSQVRDYVALLAEIFAGRKVAGWLVYIDEPAIVEVK
jgi:RecB family exonuclease